MENRKIIIGVVLTLGLIWLFKKYKAKKNVIIPSNSTSSNTVVQQTPNTPTKGDNNSISDLVSGGIKPIRNQQPIVSEEPIVVAPAPLPIDFGDGDNANFIDEYFPPNFTPIVTPTPIYIPQPTPEPIMFSPLPIDFGDGNSSVVLTNPNYTNVSNTPIYTNPINTVLGGGSGDDWNYQNTSSSTGNYGGGVRDFSYNNNQSIVNQLEL